jgi:hypothetical protein
MSEIKDSAAATEAPPPEAPVVELAARDAKIEINAETETGESPVAAGLFARAVSGARDSARAFVSRGKAFFSPVRLRPGARTKFAVSIAASLLAGASFGALAATGLGYVKPVPAPRVDTENLKSMLAQISTEVTALKSGLDITTRNVGAQLTKLTDRMDRAEKAQAEPAAKLARINDAIERIEKRAAAPSSFTTASAASDITGSVVQKQQSQTHEVPIVEGWVLRDIFDGTALIEGPRGLREVAPGSNIPGVGRVEKIKRNGGRWMVFTPRGVIVSSR